MNADQSSLYLQSFSRRKREFLDHVEATVDEQERWRSINAGYYSADRAFMRFLVPPGKRVLELGCGRGDLLASLEPSYGVGVDFSPTTIARAAARYPGLHFHLGDVEDAQTLAAIEGPFDYIVIADTIGMFEDIDVTLRLVNGLCTPATRIIVSYYSHLWEPVLKLGEWLGLKSRQPQINYIATADFLNLMDLADFEMIRHEQRQLLPRRLLGLGTFVNRYDRAASGHQAAMSADLHCRAAGPAFSRPETFCEYPDPLSQRKRQHRKRYPAHAEVRRGSGNPLRGRQFQRRDIRGMRAGPRCL